jgi:hypothetical protein
MFSIIFNSVNQQKIMMFFETREKILFAVLFLYDFVLLFYFGFLMKSKVFQKIQ